MRFIHYTYGWGLRQVPIQAAVPGVGLMEMSLRQRSGNRIKAAANPSYRTGRKRQTVLVLSRRIPV